MRSDLLPIYVCGQWRNSSSTATIEVENPTTGEVIASVAEGTVDDVAAGSSAAADAFRS